MSEYSDVIEDVGLVLVETKTAKILKEKGFEHNLIQGIKELNGNGYKFESDLEGYNIVFRLVPVHSGN